ncbi:MAG: FAD-dependent oxidoreductase [Thermoleophilia bacterium]|nr:FAD-dependent oxidoreductase [Thermoleophilia bacterium]
MVAARRVLTKWGRVPARELLERHLRDRRLIDLLGSQGVAAPIMGVVLLAQMWDFMAEEGIWYPTTGIGALAEMLAARSEAMGARLALGARVEALLVDAGRVEGVRTAGGRRLRAGYVIADIDQRHALLDLAPAGVLSAEAGAEAAERPLSPSAFTVFLGVESASVDLSAFKGHQLLVKLREGDPVPWSFRRPVADDFVADELWLSWWSRHSGPEAAAPPGHETLVLKCVAPIESFLALDGAGRGRHHAAYYALKEGYADALVAAADAVIPGLAAATRVREVATPLTYRDWGHRTEGSIAGWSWRASDVPEPWARSLVVSPVPGLLHVGLQAFTRLFAGGLGTAAYSGRSAADVVLGGMMGEHENTLLPGGAERV